MAPSAHVVTERDLIDSVDEVDRPVDRIARGEALRRGANFRTAHVFVVRDDGAILLQRLAEGRRHPARWGSSAAAYPHAGEAVEAAAKRRLRGEIGVSCPLSFVAKAAMQDGRSRKFVSLFVAELHGHVGIPAIREPNHLDDLRYWSEAEIEDILAIDPDRFTPTFPVVYGLWREAPR